MKICVSASAPGLDAQVDPRFGRCQYFTIVDTDTMEFESVENSNAATMGGAGIQAAQFVANRGVETVLTGNVGPNAYNTLQAAGVKIIGGVSGAVKKVVEAYKSGKITAPPLSGPSVGSHFGTENSAQFPGQGMSGGRGMGRGGGGGKKNG
ncbi:MAG: NifB/NifX family molybdenum-iron cluster-binding protein [Syntrophales bacterium]